MVQHGQNGGWSRLTVLAPPGDPRFTFIEVDDELGEIFLGPGGQPYMVLCENPRTLVTVRPHRGKGVKKKHSKIPDYSEKPLLPTGMTLTKWGTFGMGAGVATMEGGIYKTPRGDFTIAETVPFPADPAAFERRSAHAEALKTTPGTCYFDGLPVIDRGDTEVGSWRCKQEITFSNQKKTQMNYIRKTWPHLYWVGNKNSVTATQKVLENYLYDGKNRPQWLDVVEFTIDDFKNLKPPELSVNLAGKTWFCPPLIKTSPHITYATFVWARTLLLKGPRTWASALSSPGVTDMLEKTYNDDCRDVAFRLGDILRRQPLFEKQELLRVANCVVNCVKGATFEMAKEMCSADSFTPAYRVSPATFAFDKNRACRRIYHDLVTDVQTAYVCNKCALTFQPKATSSANSHLRPRFALLPDDRILDLKPAPWEPKPKYVSTKPEHFFHRTKLRFADVMAAHASMKSEGPTELRTIVKEMREDHARLGACKWCDQKLASLRSPGNCPLLIDYEADLVDERLSLADLRKKRIMSGDFEENLSLAQVRRKRKKRRK